MATKEECVSHFRQSTACMRFGALLVALLITAPAAAQVTQPTWWPPMTLYGRPVSSPFFDFPVWARYSNCRPAPLAWGFDPFANYGPCDLNPNNCYPTINCPGNFVAHRPNGWYFSADFAPTFVDPEFTRPLATLGPTGRTVLSTSDLQENLDAGTRITIGRRMGCYRLEGTYWGSFQWKGYAAVTDTSGAGGTGTLASILSGGFGNAAVPALDNNFFVSAEDRTKMNNAELNLLYWINMPPGGLDVSLIFGGRYLDIRDQFNLNTLNTVQDNLLQVNTINSMAFIQTGISTDWLVAQRMWINGTLKGGLANNHASLVSNYTFTPAGGTTSINVNQDTRNRTAGLLDLSLVGHWQVTPWLVARLGYQALFVSSVAFGQDNIQTQNQQLINGPAIVSARSNAAFHGPLIGIMGNW